MKEIRNASGIDETAVDDHDVREPPPTSLPFGLYRALFREQQRWRAEATTGVRGVTRHHERIVSFAAR